MHTLQSRTLYRAASLLTASSKSEAREVIIGLENKIGGNLAY